MEQEIEEIFEQANKQFLKNHVALLEADVSERTLCGALMIELHEILKNTSYAEYYADVEYNRSTDGTIKTCAKRITNEVKEIKINCDLIVHSRGTKSLDNLIAIEMKKSRAKKVSKDSDRDRLKALTIHDFDGTISSDGKTIPKYVCNYQLGVYYEINDKYRSILIEYYHQEVCTNSYTIAY